MTTQPGELVILRGLQGSGKTTHAETMAFLDGGRVVGRDHIRKLMGIDGLGTRKQEDEVTAIQGRLIAAGLTSGQHVYVDDMNLKAAYVKRLMGIAHKYGASWYIEDLTYVPLEVCLERNRARSRFVPEYVIQSNHKKFIANQKYPLPVPEAPVFDNKLIPVTPYVPDITRPRAFLVDIDGTVALKGARGIHDYDLVGLDLPNPAVIKLIQSAIVGGSGVPIFVSGRPDSCREDTRMWLSKHVSTFGPLYMRRTGDHRADYLIKRELFDAEIRDKYNVIAAFDDRNQVVDMYREMGLTVLQVADGNF